MFYRGFPSTGYKKSKNIESDPCTICKYSKNIERTLIWWTKIKTWTLSKNVKIDTQEYIYQGSSLTWL